MEVWGYEGVPLRAGVSGSHFNRYPTLVTAAARRLLGLACAAYFDDNLLVDFEHSACSGKLLEQKLFTILGTPKTE